MQIDLDFDTIIKLLSPILVAIFGAIAKHFIEGRPKLVTYLIHATSHPVMVTPPANASDEAKLTAVGTDVTQTSSPRSIPAQDIRYVHTHAIVVRNTGKKSAHNVRINHEVFPVSYQLSPNIHHQVTAGPGSAAEICIPVLVPNEQVTISYLYFPPLVWSQISGTVKSDEVMAKAINAIPMNPPPRGVRWIFWSVLFVGASTIVYWLLKLLPYVL